MYIYARRALPANFSLADRDKRGRVCAVRCWCFLELFAPRVRDSEALS